MKTFEVTEEHLKLLQHAYFSFEHQVEFGAPGMNQKRPYGNSNVFSDMAEILGIEGQDDGWGGTEYSQEQEDYMFKLHEELTTVLNIIVRNNNVKPRVYGADDYRENWVPVI